MPATYKDEITRIQENFCKLIEAISEPAKFAARLYSAKLITSEMRDNAMNENQPSCGRIMKLISAVEAQIKAFPEENFGKFVRTLCEEDCYQMLARSLHAELGKQIQ